MSSGWRVAMPGAARPKTRPPDGDGLLEDAEAAAGGELAEVGELHAEAQVRLVRAEAVDRLAIGEARERGAGDGAVRARRRG